MCLLKFNVYAQQITVDPSSNFSYNHAGSKEYSQAYFAFSSEWDNCVKVASFWQGKNEYAVLIENNECYIPPEVLSKTVFKISVIGQSDNYRITTNRLLVKLEVDK